MDTNHRTNSELSEMEKIYSGNVRFSRKYTRHKLENANCIMDLELEKSLQQLQILINISR